MDMKVEAVVMIILVMLISMMIVVVMSALLKKAKQAGISNLIKAECVSANQGEIKINLTDISQGVLDVLTQGFTLENFDAKLKWRKRGNKCIYTIVIEGREGDTVVSRESEEIEVPNCPG
jgi:hypothetical protein